MSKLVKLRTTDNKEIYLNPDHVVLVTGSQLIGETNITPIFGVVPPGTALSVKGTPDDVAALLNNQDSVHYANLFN